jgi:hypothetical protein
MPALHLSDRVCLLSLATTLIIGPSNAHFLPRLGGSGGRAGLQPRRNCDSLLLFVPRPAPLAAASGAGRGTQEQSIRPFKGGAEAPPFQTRGEKSRLKILAVVSRWFDEPTMRSHNSLSKAGYSGPPRHISPFFSTLSRVRSDKWLIFLEHHGFEPSGFYIWLVISNITGYPCIFHHLFFSVSSLLVVLLTDLFSMV